MPLCAYDISSENYSDFIISNNIDLTNIPESSSIVCRTRVDSLFSIIYVPRTVTNEFIPFPYAVIPSLYTSLDTTSMSASGISLILDQPFLELRGQGTMIGFIDTGIDYRNPLFRYSNGTTRILGIWDQSIKQTIENNEMLYGTEFTRERINEALYSNAPLEIVPSMDENGHGTFMAGIAAGNVSLENDFTGAAPDCAIGVVKLKPAKQYLRDFYCIQESADAYQENDIMVAIQYLIELAARYNMPLVIYIGVGTNYGSHEGTSPLGIMLRRINQIPGITTVLPAGNETGLGHHYRGQFSQNQNYNDVELRVGGNEAGLVIQLWANSPEAYSVGFISPLGRIIQRIPINYQTGTTISLVLELTEITVYYGLSQYGSGSHYIFIRLKDPTPGIWKIRVFNSLYISGNYHLWLPIQGFISDDTFFLNPDPDTIITEPGNAYATITVGAFNHYNNSIYIHSSRGFNRINIVKPDLVAPGVDVYGPGLSPGSQGLNFPMVRQTGSSVAAAHVAGAAAILMTWGIVERNRLNMTTSAIKSILIRGADRNLNFEFPNTAWGFGILNLYQSFLSLMD